VFRVPATVTSPKPTGANVSAGSKRGNPSRGKAVLRQRNNAFSYPQPSNEQRVAEAESERL
jgi:hypothetical protein